VIFFWFMALRKCQNVSSQWEPVGAVTGG
jgi:hypothetical protein